MKNKILIIAGPTAVGKTSTSLKIAKEIGGEIVSADSMQIYRGLDIGTAKPTKKEQSEAPHHMIDICSPSEKFSVARYIEEATGVIEDIFRRGHTPIVVGGTGLYIDNLVYNNDFGDFEIDEKIHNNLVERANAEGGKKLLDELLLIDPNVAARLHENDIRRIVRSLEIYYSTGKNQSYFLENSRTKTSRYSFEYSVLNCSSRDVLYERINARVDSMMEEGLLKEAEMVLKAPWYENSTASQAIGYKEFFDYFCDKKTLEECVNLLKQHSRNYAKRQLTWFRHKDEGRFYNVDSEENIADRIMDSFFKKGN